MLEEPKSRQTASRQNPGRDLLDRLPAGRHQTRRKTVRCAWEGGSAAFARHDELSDIDAVAVVADDAVQDVFARVERALATLSPIELQLTMPPQPGYAQRFYRLRDAGEFLVIDFVRFRRGDPLLFREVELHGSGTTWFDRTGVLVERHLDLAADLQHAPRYGRRDHRRPALVPAADVSRLRDRPRGVDRVALVARRASQRRHCRHGMTRLPSSRSGNAPCATSHR